MGKDVIIALDFDKRGWGWACLEQVAGGFGDIKFFWI